MKHKRNESTTTESTESTITTEQPPVEVVQEPIVEVAHVSEILPDLTQTDGNTALAVAPKVEELPYDDVKLRSFKTKSEQIRYLNSLGLKNGPISKILTTVYGKLVRYQHVRNVLNQKLSAKNS